MKKHLHILAFLIIAILILTEPLSVLASSTAGSGANDRYETDAEIGTEAQDEMDEKGVSFLIFESLFRELKDLIPSAISLVDARINRHIRRCLELEESLYEVIFQNDDESFTEYFFDYPVKYTDTSGLTPIVRDISLILTKTGQSFKSTAHSIAATFPKYLSEGITLNGDKISIAMFPDINREKKGKLSGDGTKVSYTLDSSTSLEYALTYLGFK